MANILSDKEVKWLLELIRWAVDNGHITTTDSLSTKEFRMIELKALIVKLRS